MRDVFNELQRIINALKKTESAPTSTPWDRNSRKYFPFYPKQHSGKQRWEQSTSCEKLIGVRPFQ